MAKTTGPLMSLAASGSVASTLTYSVWKGRAYVRQLVTPSNPKTPAQTSFRAMFGFLASIWKTMAPTPQGSWNTLAAATNVSPFNAFTQFNQKRWTQTNTPSDTPTIANTTPDDPISFSATGGVGQIQIHIAQANVVPEDWGIVIYRNTVTGFTPTQNDVIAVIPCAQGAIVDFVDSGLTPGAYFYRCLAFSTDGGNFLHVAEVTATAT